MTIPIKFRGEPLGSEHFDTKVKYVYGGYYCYDGIEYVVTPREYIKVKNVAQLVGYDCYRREVYTGDALLDEIDNEHVARLGDNPNSLSAMRLKPCFNSKSKPRRSALRGD